MPSLPSEPSDRERATASTRAFTLSSTKPDNKVILQRSFQGHGCIPPELADKLIKDPKILLRHLNGIFGTHYTLLFTPSLKALLKYCIEKDYDLGMAYGLLRPYWFSESELSSLSSDLLLREREDSERRTRAVGNGFVVDQGISPRRVWDLHSNRVLPFWMLPSSIQNSWNRQKSFQVMEIMAVSHAWVFHKNRTAVTTPINGKKWPVPVPNDTSLDDLRIELLN